ncbi:MAG TPA: hypothetical protein VKH81_14150 [Candidatus Angelobacter sp.]|nr:hypothetical protein [Candidatus Angelobacter sp.]
MSNLAVSLLVLVCVFGGALLGIFLRRTLPQDHLSSESKSTVNLAIGLVATLAALVLGLVVSAAASSFFAQRDEWNQVCAKIVVLDRVLDHYGPAAQKARQQLREVVEDILYRMWPQERVPGSNVPQKISDPEAVYESIQRLSPQSEEQRDLKHDALGIALEIGRTRWMMFVQQTSPLPTPFLVIVVFWITVVYMSFGLYAPRNATVIVALLLGALSVAGAIVLIMELYSPYSGGIIHISSLPLRSALAEMGK